MPQVGSASSAAFPSSILNRKEEHGERWRRFNVVSQSADLQVNSLVTVQQ